jgi:shikimate kinase
MLIFLVGFMGSGKSYVGRNLAPLLGYVHVDLDKWIEEKEATTIAALFEKKGEEYFRELESRYLHALDPDQSLVISTGGGAPCFFDNMKTMNEKGLTIYLNRSKEIVIPRLLKGLHKRPLIAGMSEQELEKFYDEKLQSRKRFYEQAKLHVDDADVEEIFRMIENAGF